MAHSGWPPRLKLLPCTNLPMSVAVLQSTIGWCALAHLHVLSSVLAPNSERYYHTGRARTGPCCNFIILKRGVGSAKGQPLCNWPGDQRGAAAALSNVLQKHSTEPRAGIAAAWHSSLCPGQSCQGPRSYIELTPLLWLKMAPKWISEALCV